MNYLGLPLIKQHDFEDILLQSIPDSFLGKALEAEQGPLPDISEPLSALNRQVQLLPRFTSAMWRKIGMFWNRRNNNPSDWPGG